MTDDYQSNEGDDDDGKHHKVCHLQLRPPSESPEEN